MKAKKSAEQNDSESQYLVGKSFLEGKGVSRNSEQAVYWFRKGAENGDEDACASLSLCYLTGTGVEKNLEESKKWKEKGENISKQ